MLKGLAATAAGLLASAVLSGCVTPAPVPSSAPAPQSVSPTPSPSPTPTMSLDDGQDRAARVVQLYYQVMDQIAADRTIPLDSLYQAATGEAARYQLRALQELHTNNLVWEGDTSVEVSDVSGTTAPYQVDACIDTSAVTVEDQQGNSLADPNDPTRRLWRFTVEDISGKLLVTTEQVLADSC